MSPKPPSWGRGTALAVEGVFLGIELLNLYCTRTPPPDSVGSPLAEGAFHWIRPFTYKSIKNLLSEQCLGVELIKVERIFWKVPKTFLQESFLRSFFQKSDINPQHKLTSTPTSLFLLAQKAQKKKLCKKKTPFLWGVAPNPIRFLKKAKPKTFKLGRQCRQPSSGIVASNLKLNTPTA